VFRLEIAGWVEQKVMQKRRENKWLAGREALKTSNSLRHL
jgi:hypothetical protein